MLNTKIQKWFLRIFFPFYLNKILHLKILTAVHRMEVILRKHLSFTKDALPVAERFCPLNWQMGGPGFNPQSCLSIQPFGVFCGFLRNSSKYKLGYLSTTPTEDTPHIVLGPQCSQSDVYLQPNFLKILIISCNPDPDL